MSELASVDGKIDRYLTAFENGQLTTEQCGQRIEKLGQQASQLRTRRDELQDTLLNVPEIPTPTNLEILRKYIAETVRLGDPAQLEQLISALVAQVVVTDRDDIQPYFYLPAAAPGQELGEKVRPLYGSVRPAGFEPATNCLEGSCSIH